MSTTDVLDRVSLMPYIIRSLHTQVYMILC